MGTYCLPWTPPPLILDIISRTLHGSSYREANNSLTAPLNTSVRFHNRGLTDRWTDEWMDRQTDRHAGMSEEACWRGRREGASAGGFEEQPWLLWIRISPDAGGRPRRAAAVPTGQGTHKWFNMSSPKTVTNVCNKPSNVCLSQI